MSSLYSGLTTSVSCVIYRVRYSINFKLTNPMGERVFLVNALLQYRNAVSVSLSTQKYRAECAQLTIIIEPSSARSNIEP